MIFWIGMQRTVALRANSNGAGKTFVYRFDINRKLNIFKASDKKLIEFPGSAHGDDLGYLFNTFLTPEIGIQSKEFEVVREVVRKKTL